MSHPPPPSPLDVASLLPRLLDDLGHLVAIPSVSSPGFPEPRQPLLDAYEAIAALLRDAGVENVAPLELPDTAPIVTGEIPAPEGAPTVLLYGHYDVVPAGDEAAWSSPPFEAAVRDGAVYGRGTADSKSNILVHVGALRAWQGRPPVGVKILIEGQEEVGSALETPSELGRFVADALLIADGGNIRPGEPSLTVSIRGDAAITVEARTLRGPKHSGQYGGAAPDALIALLHGLATLHDANGDVAVEGLRRSAWDGVTDTEEEFREFAEVLPGTPLFGTGGLGERIWTGPAITVTGLDAAPVKAAVNAVCPYARAKLNLRVHPEQDAAEAQAAVIRHLEAVRPFGIQLRAEAGDAGSGFRGQTAGPAWDAMIAAMRKAWGKDAVAIATGGGIPLVKALSLAIPDATVLLFGTTDKFAQIHAPNERVLIAEFEKAVLAEALFFREYAERWRGAR